MRTQESEWEVLPPAGAPAPRVAASAQTEWEVLPPAAPRAAAQAAGRPPRSVGQRFLGNLADTFQTGWMAEGFREGAQAGARGFEPDRSFIPNPARSAGAVVNAFRQIFDPAGATAYAEGLIGQERARRGQFAAVSRDDPFYRAPGGPVDVALAGLGTAGGVLAGAALDPLSYVSPGRTVAQRALAQGGLSFATDAAAQGSGMATGLQEGYDARRALISAGTGAAFSAGADVLGMGINRMFPRAAAPVDGGPTAPAAAPEPEVRIDLETGRPYVTTASVDITPAEADALVAAGTHRRDPATGAVYRYVGATDQAPAALLPDVEVTAAAPGAVERMPMQGDAPQGARVAAADGTPEVLPRADGAVEAVQPDGSIVVSRPDAPDEIIPATRAAEPVEVLLPDGAVEVRPRVLAEDAGAPGRAPDEVLLGPAVRALDDEFGIPPQPSPAVARAAEAGLTLRAPDEPRAPDARAGNLLLNKFDSTLDVATVLEAADTAAGGFAEARRAPQSFAQTEALAEQLGMTADELLKRPNGTAFNAEQSQAARSLLVASAEKVDAIAARIAQKGDPGEDLLNEFRDTVLRHVAIQEQVAGVVAEAGRALGILRNRASSVNITADMLDAMMAGKGPAGLQRAARNIVEAGKKGPREQAKAIEKAYKATGFDVFLEYWYNAILSGPYTHLYNVLSTGANVLNNLPVTATAAAVGAGKKLTGVQWGVERDRVLGSEVYARGVGMLTGVVEGVRAFKHTFMTGSVSDNVDRLDTQVRQAITSSRPGVAGASIRALGTAVRTPSRLLSAEDELFKAIARRMQLNGISLRMAHAEGLRGDAMTARAAELAKNPTEYLSAEADNFARYLTFQTEMGPGGRGILRTLDAWPASRIVVPFVRTPINLMKTTVEHSPFAPLLTEWRDDVKAGGARADVALAKMVVGMGYGLAIATAAGYGLVTGAAPADKTERKALEAAGWKPFSIRVGNQYIDYRRMDPFASSLGIASTLGQPQTPHGKPVDLASAFVSGFLGQLTDKTFLTGLSDFVVAASDESGSKLEAWVKRFAGSFVPALASQTAQMIDPTKRTTRTMADTQPPQPEQPLDTARRVAEVLGDTMQSRIPGMSQNLPAQRDILGDPLRAASPVTPVENDRAAQAIVSTGANVGEPGKTLQGRKLTGQEYDAYERLAGQYLRKGIENWIDTPDWLEMDDEGRRELIEDLADEAREDARQELDLDRPAE